MSDEQGQIILAAEVMLSMGGPPMGVVVKVGVIHPGATKPNVTAVLVDRDTALRFADDIKATAEECPEEDEEDEQHGA